MIEFKTEMFTHQGGRPNNEDYCGFVTLKDFACWVLADGVGGHNGGEVASQAAVETVLDAFKAEPAVSSRHLMMYLEKAQEAIVEKQKDPALYSMRTTIVVLVSDYKNALWAHIGDSRLYLLKGSRIYFQTKDHSVPQALADAGQISAEEVRYHEDRNRILRSLGNEGPVKATIPDNTKVPVAKGDAFLLCTDGFWEHVTETELEIDYAKSGNPTEWLRHMQGRIVRRVDGEYDNYSAIAVTIE
jgi:serine/threonine protein phosphatase PrpC